MDDNDDGSVTYLPPDMAMSTTSTTAPRKRRNPYTNVACQECKRRKVKCSGENPCAGCQQVQAVCLYERSTRFRAGRRSSMISSRSREDIHTNGGQSEMAIGESLSTLADDEATQTVAGQSPRPIRPGSSDYYFNLAQQLLVDSSPLHETDHQEVRESPKMAQELRKLIQDRSTCESLPLLSVITLSRWLEILDFYEEEIGLVYPFLNVTDIRNQLRDISSSNFTSAETPRREVRIDIKLEETLTLVLAVMAVLEEPNVGGICDEFVEHIMVPTWRRSHAGNVGDHDVNLSILMSIYYFMTDREPLAWRNIGGVVRMLQELGYHNFTDLQHRYKSRGSRETAKKVLWSAYMLDRRWSFGTGLPFAIHDSDIDYDVDFMDKSLSSAYMKAMVTYCRIAAEVRDSALGMPSPNHAKDSARDLLDFKIGGWRHNLPSCLQFHSDMDFDPLQGTRGQYRLRLLLYLRANQMRIVIHRKSSLRVGNDAIDTSSINAMVEVAQDTIRVLAKLSQGSNIYHAQQKTFNHFLESALSALLLVTCRSRVLGERACAAEVQLALEVIERLSTSSSITKKLAEKLRCFTATVQELPQSQSVGSGAESKRPPTGGDVASIHPHAKDRMHVLYGETTEVSSHQNDASFEQLHHNGIGHNSLLSAIVNGQSLQTSLPGPSQTQQTMTCGLLSSGFNMVAQDFVPPLLYNFGSGHSEISPNSTTGDPTLVGTSDMAAVDLDVTTTEKWDGLLSELGDFWDDYDRMITF